MSQFKRLERKKVFLKLGLMGPSGSGKTYSALLLAKGLANGGKIAALDTENGSLSLYAHLAEVDGIDFRPPFEPKKAVAAIEAAVAEGYSVLVIDSVTHFWKWILDFKESLDRAGGNSYTNWGKAKPHFDALKEAMLHAPLHIVCCMRAKDEYVLERNDKGKEAPRKVGMGAIMEPGAEYEYTTVFELSMDHHAIASKDRTGMFDGEFARISEKTGERFLEWLASGKGQQLEVLAPAVSFLDRTDDPTADEVRRTVAYGSAHFTAEEAKRIMDEAKAAGVKPRFLILEAERRGVADADAVIALLDRPKAPAAPPADVPENPDLFGEGANPSASAETATAEGATSAPSAGAAAPETKPSVGAKKPSAPTDESRVKATA